MSRDERGSEVVEWALNDCYVKAVTATSIGLYSKPRDMILWFPKKVPMEWIISRGRPDVHDGSRAILATNAEMTKGSTPIAVKLPRWLKMAKQKEVLDASQETAA